MIKKEKIDKNNVVKFKPKITDLEKDLDMALSLLTGALRNNPEYAKMCHDWVKNGEVIQLIDGEDFNPWTLDGYGGSADQLKRHLRLMRKAIDDLK